MAVLKSFYKTKKGMFEDYTEELPTNGVWETIGMKRRSGKDNVFRLRCVMPTDEKRKYFSEITITEEFIDTAMDIVNIIEGDGWISVKDKLPENDDDVLAFWIGWDRMECVRTLSYDNVGKEWLDWNGEEYERIQFWKPVIIMPQNYKFDNE